MNNLAVVFTMAGSSFIPIEMGLCNAPLLPPCKLALRLPLLPLFGTRIALKSKPANAIKPQTYFLKCDKTDFHFNLKY